MPAKCHTEKPNVTASIYDGEFTLIVECPPSGRCKLARFYTDPPEDGERCVWETGGQGCNLPAAHADAIRALQEHLAKKLTELEGEVTP